MKLYLISQTKNDDYDTYSDAVVVAENQDEAVTIHPDNYEFAVEGRFVGEGKYGTWCESIADVNVVYIGEANPSLCKGVICASFHAG